MIKRMILNNIRLRLLTPRLIQPIIYRQLPTFTKFQRFYSISTEGELIDGKIDQITDSQYNQISDEYLELMSDALEDLNENYEQIESELNHGVLTITAPPNGVYVINKQPPNKQIWLSSPVSGPKRFDLIQGEWRTLRDGSLLTKIVQEEISEAIGKKFEFDEIDS
ncbi:unnamed protein product [Candida verbasci]|uniref:ferroxidase n=1 Tax=Candida verbasci TaxID=1227364 RepID=A0A9W4XB61_9ASCO|nr:unnamed protein product [Candida verbasci]